MRVTLINRANADSEAGERPRRKMFATMESLLAKVNETGGLLAAGGLTPSSHRVRVRTNGGRGAVTDGPFTETKELIAGLTMIEVNSKSDSAGQTRMAIDVVDGKVNDGDEIGPRPLLDNDDAVTLELRETANRLRA